MNIFFHFENMELFSSFLNNDASPTLETSFMPYFYLILNIFILYCRKHYITVYYTKIKQCQEQFPSSCFMAKIVGFLRNDLYKCIYVYFSTFWWRNVFGKIKIHFLRNSVTKFLDSLVPRISTAISSRWYVSKCQRYISFP